MASVVVVDEQPTEEPVADPLVYPLSFAQQRLWFLDQMNPGDVSYNVPLGLRVRGPLNLTALSRAIQALVARHDVFRTRLLVIDGQPSQVVSADPALDIDVRTVDMAPEAFEAEVRAVLQRETSTPLRTPGHSSSSPVRSRSSTAHLPPGRTPISPSSPSSTGTTPSGSASGSPVLSSKVSCSIGARA
jgi:hypothetical protein